MSWRRPFLVLILGTAWVGALLLAAPAFWDIFLTIRLLTNLNQAGDISTAKGLRTVELAESRSGSEETLQGRLYLPDSIRGPGILFLPGLTRQGYDHPRFTAVARALARTGFPILTPDIRVLKELRLEESSLEETIFWLDWWLHRSPQKGRRVGLLGVSVGGTLGLKAAAKRSQQVSFVVSIGGYQDLERCRQRWFGGGDSTLRHGDYPVRYYGKWIWMLTVLEALQPASNREPLRSILYALIEKGRLEAGGPELSEEGQRWLRIATHDSVGELFGTALPPNPDRLHRLSANRELSRVQCPVFLVHGLQDELIPPSETLELRDLLVRAPTSVLLTPLISHTHPLWQELNDLRKGWALLRLSCFLHGFVSITSRES